MNKKEAIIAMMEGKKVRCEAWNNTAWLVYCDKEEAFIDDLGIIRETNDFSNDSIWELYEDPNPKGKYYRRQWIIDFHGKLITDHCWFKTKQAFDDYYCGYGISSDEWQEMEI